MRQPPGTGDIIEIDVIDADPSVFGGHDAPGEPRVRRRPPRRVLVTVVIVVAVMSTAALVWRPWQHAPTWRTFAAAPPAASSLTDQLVLDLPSSRILGLQPGQNLAADEPTPLGYVFAEADGTYDYGTWALFHSRASNGRGEVTPSKSTAVVRGLQAKVRHVRVRTTVTWGPIDGNYWDVESNRLDGPAALEFANAVGVVEGVPAIERSYSLGTLLPLGDVETLTRVQVLASHLGGEPVLSRFTPTVLTYEGDTAPVLAASIVADSDALAMAEFYFGRGSNIIVHGLPALLIETRRLGTLIVWQEGDRLVAVAGAEPTARMISLAESVHPATRAEWAQVIDEVTDVETFRVDTAQQVTFSTGNTPDGLAWRASITLGNPVVICVHFGPADSSMAECIFSTPLSPATHVIGTESLNAFVVAVLPIGIAQQLVVTDVTGNSTAYEPVPVDATTSAVAALLPLGATYELVDPST
ncbi:MAG: hypothetical protein IPP16_02515 [Acidimicrobiaceae bacterium]|nr:hypothetical protein [Acidimicrobiaceae bacterium]